MEKKLQNRCRMADSSLLVMDKYQSIWDSSEVMHNVYNNVKGLRAEIAADDSLAAVKTGGITVDKSAIRDNLEQMIYQVASALYAYGYAQGNALLWKSVMFTTSDLADEREQTLLRIASDVLKLGREHASVLEAYHITSDDLTKLEQLTMEFDQITSKGRAIVSSRSVANEALADKVSLLTELFKHQMDRLMVNYRITHPDFFKAYHNARKVVEYGTRHENDETTETEGAK
jgi:hypothetical protein